jgi:hypothetical protein
MKGSPIAKSREVEHDAFAPAGKPDRSMAALHSRDEVRRR